MRLGADIEVVERHAGVGGQLVTLRTPGATYEGIFIPLFGAHQAHNAAMALAAVEALMADGGDEGSLPPGVVEQGFARVTSPGRLETIRRSPTIVVDAAHNPHGVDAVAEAIEESFAFSTLVGVVCVLDDKDADGILAGLEPFLDEVVITKSTSPRAMDVNELGKIASSPLWRGQGDSPGRPAERHRSGGPDCGGGRRHDRWSARHRLHLARGRRAHHDGRGPEARGAAA